jgi:peroxiredoxin (alkyl hydroperoxide reductase subunit C)
MPLRPLQRLQIGDEAPDFSLPATGDTAGQGQKRKQVALKNYRGKKNVVLAFFPAAFTPICTAQLPSFEQRTADFDRLNAQVLAISTDNVFSQEGWAATLGGLSFPVLSDFWPHGFVAIKYGVLREEGIAERAVFVVDKSGVIRYIDIHNINEEPPIDPIIHALQHHCR